MRHWLGDFILAIVAVLVLGSAIAQSGFEVLQGRDLPGGDYLTIEGGRHAQCAAKCANDPVCRGYTYNTGKKVCFLKESTGKAKRFSGAISARKLDASAQSSGAQQRTMTYEMFDNADMPGGDLDVLKGVALGECEQACATRPECQAFTQNVAKSVCFLKSGAGAPQHFSGAVSGRKVGGAQAAVAQAAPKGKLSAGFVIYGDADLPGGDGAMIDQQAGSLEACQLQCLFSDACDAFSYDAATNFCAGKSRKHIGGDRLSPVQRAGATSGIKASPIEVAGARMRYIRSGPTVPEADLAWRNDDSAAAFVARLRAAAKPMGASCDAERAQMQEVAASIRAEIVTDGVVAGQAVALRWTARPKEKAPPLWLMVSADGPVRFKAPGFYALTPGAIGPFGISVDSDRTRALTTLFGRGAIDKAEMDVVALRAGALNVRVGAIGYLRACEEEFSHEVTTATIPVSRSPIPTFQVRDPFSFDMPKKAWLSPDGTTRLEVFDGRFRLVDIASGAFIADREGRDPYYSPTGRFVSFLVGGGDDFYTGDDNYEVIDASDGGTVSRTSGLLGWENSDSFLVVGGSGLGRISAASLLVSESEVGSESGCRVCSGRDESYVLDLENDVVHDGVSNYAMRLSGARQTPTISAGGKEATIRFIAEQTGSAPAYFPERWNFRGGLIFVPFEQWVDTANGGKPTASQIEEKESMFFAKMLQGTAGTQVAGLQPVGIGEWRGAVRLERPKSGRDALRGRLSDLGVRISDDRAPNFVGGKPDGMSRADGMSFMQPAIAARIVAAVPKAKGVFADTRDTHNCNPDFVAPNGLEALFSIFDRAMEFRIGDRSIWLTLYVCASAASAASYADNFNLFDSDNKDAFSRIEDGRLRDSMSAGTGHFRYFNFDARLYADRYLLIWSTESRAVMLFDIETRKAIYEEADLGRGDLLKEAFYSVESQHITQVNSDGSFYVYDVPGKKRVMEGRYVDDETIAWTPDLRFDASPEGANYVNLRFPGESGQYSFQQFASLVKRPGLVTEVFERRYKASDTVLPLPPTLSGEIAMRGARISGRVRAVGAVELRVYQDGLLSDTIGIPKDQDMVSVDVARLPGARWISFMAFDAKGIASLPVGRDISGDAAILPTVHALAVGVDRYETLPVLRYAAKDAGTLVGALEAQFGKSIRRGVVDTLTDMDATPAAILGAAERLVGKAAKGETIVLSFAGHGVTDPTGRFYLATSNTKADDIANTALPWDRLASVLARSKARVVVFLDACHSGTAGTSLFSTNDDAAEDVLARVPSGFLVFSASKGRQFSEESPGAGGGLFTNAVADVIAGKRTAFDLDRNGAIEISELYAGVKRRVSELSEGRQIPWLARNELVGDFAIF